MVNILCVRLECMAFFHKLPIPARKSGLSVYVDIFSEGKTKSIVEKAIKNIRKTATWNS